MCTFQTVAIFLSQRYYDIIKKRDHMIKNIVCWADIAVTDLDRAIKFYSIIMGVEVKKQTSEIGDFGIFPHEDCVVGACLSAESKPSQDGSLIYLDATGFIDEAAARVESAGGKVLVPKMEIGEYGSRVIILDTEGNRIAPYAAPENMKWTSEHTCCS